MLKPIYVFSGASYYPNGGFGDFSGEFATFNDALRFCEEVVERCTEEEIEYLPHAWQQIVTDNRIIIQRGGTYKNPTEWHLGDNEWDNWNDSSAIETAAVKKWAIDLPYELKSGEK